MKDKEIDYFFQQQGAKSFVKFKMDWAKYGKIHLSFVQHEGKDAGCKQVASIDAALSANGANSALYLAELVLSGAARQLATKRRQEAKSANKNFAEPFFSNNGGTVQSRSKTGGAIYRSITLAPGNKSDYVLQAVEAEGEMTATGGIKMKSGAAVTRITVAVSTAELVTMARSIIIEWTAYRTAALSKGESMSESRDDDTNGSPSHAQQENVAEDHASQPPHKEKAAPLSVVYVIYDQTGNVFEVVDSAKLAELKIRESLKHLYAMPDEYRVAREEDCATIKNAIYTGADVIPALPLVSKKDARKTSCLIILRKEVGRT